MLQYGNTPLFHASRECRLDVVKCLVEECKADVDASDKVKQLTESNRLFGPTTSADCCHDHC